MNKKKQIAPFNKYEKKFNSNPVNVSTSCSLCHSTHDKLLDCLVFPLFSFNEKWTHVKDKNICFLCLTPRHQRSECTAPRCTLCDKYHHTMLHNPRRVSEYLSPLKPETPLKPEAPLNPEAPPYSSGTVSVRNNGHPRSPTRSYFTYRSHVTEKSNKKS